MFNINIFPHSHGEQGEHPKSSSFDHWEIRHWLENVLIEEQSGLPSWTLEGRKSQTGMAWWRERERRARTNAYMMDLCE